MPIYEYVCQKCDHHLEMMQKLSDKPLSKCPECRGKLEKIFSQTSFQLKGAGWYVTDYAGRGKTEKTEIAEKKPEGEGSEKKEPGEKAKKEPSEKSEKKDKKETAKTGAATSKSAPTGKSDN